MGGAAVYRCDKPIVLIAGFSPWGLLRFLTPETLTPAFRFSSSRGRTRPILRAQIPAMKVACQEIFVLMKPKPIIAVAMVLLLGVEIKMASARQRTRSDEGGQCGTG